MKEFRRQYDTARTCITKIYDEDLLNWLALGKVLKQSDKVSFLHISQ